MVGSSVYEPRATLREAHQQVDSLVFESRPRDRAYREVRPRKAPLRWLAHTLKQEDPDMPGNPVSSTAPVRR